MLGSTALLHLYLRTLYNLEHQLLILVEKKVVPMEWMGCNRVSHAALLPNFTAVPAMKGKQRLEYRGRHTNVKAHPTVGE